MLTVEITDVKSEEKDDLDISDDAMTAVFSFLNLDDLFATGIVSKHFLQISRNPRLWKEANAWATGQFFQGYIPDYRNTYGKVVFERHEQKRREEAQIRLAAAAKRAEILKKIFNYGFSITFILLASASLIVLDLTSSVLYFTVLLGLSLVFCVQPMYYIAQAQYSHFPKSYLKFVVAFILSLILSSILIIIKFSTGSQTLTWTICFLPVLLVLGTLVFGIFCFVWYTESDEDIREDAMRLSACLVVLALLCIFALILVGWRVDGTIFSTWKLILIPLYAVCAIAVILAVLTCQIGIFWVVIVSFVACVCSIAFPLLLTLQLYDIITIPPAVLVLIFGGFCSLTFVFELYVVIHISVMDGD